MSSRIQEFIREKQIARSPDGFARPAEEEERLNALCRSLLTTPEGEAFMAYLRSITVHQVCAPDVSDAELRMMEGMRRVVGILDARRFSTPRQE